MTNTRLLLCALIIGLLCSCSGGTPRVPNAGVELSKTEGISLIRLSAPKAKGHGRFELNAKDTYELEAYSLDIVSLIELIAPNYRVSVRDQVPAGRYDYFLDSKLFPSTSAIMQRLTIQQASFKEIERALKMKIKMDVAKRVIVVE